MDFIRSFVPCPSFQYQIRTLLGDHHDGGVGIASHQAWKY
jgi:hypothetical protein